jgi:hypothetical protein
MKQASRVDPGPSPSQVPAQLMTAIAAVGNLARMRSSIPGIAAAPTFQPSIGGWIVRIYPDGIRQRPARP